MFVVPELEGRMSRISSTLILLVGVGVPVGLYLATAPSSPRTVAPVTAIANLCFTAGAVTYQVSADAAADYRVKIGADRGDQRIALVDDVATADFALVDGAGGFDACQPAGRIKTVNVVGEGSEADVTLSLSREPADADFKLFVHSAHLRASDVAAAIAVMRLQQRNRQLAEVR
jgi:hypothetical protein